MSAGRSAGRSACGIVSAHRAGGRGCDSDTARTGGRRGCLNGRARRGRAAGIVTGGKSGAFEDSFCDALGGVKQQDVADVTVDFPRDRVAHVGEQCLPRGGKEKRVCAGTYQKNYAFV